MKGICKMNNQKRKKLHHIRYLRDKMWKHHLQGKDSKGTGAYHTSIQQWIKVDEHRGKLQSLEWLKIPRNMVIMVIVKDLE